MNPQRRHPLQRLGLLLIALALLFALVAAGYALSQPQITIYDGDEVHAVSGEPNTVRAAIAAAGLELSSADRVSPPLTALPAPQTPIVIDRAAQVRLRTESDEIIYYTHAPSVGRFLDEIGVEPARTDRISADGQAVLYHELDDAPLPAELEIGRFHTVTIVDGDEHHLRRTTGQTVGDVLQEAGITLYGADGVEPPLGSWLAPDMTIVVRRAHPVTLVVDGRVVETRSHHDNVLDVLAEAGVGLVGHDFTIPDETARLRPGDTIRVVRVTEDFRTEDEPIPFETLWQPSGELDIDTIGLLQSGETGILRRRIRVRYEDGIAVGESVDGEWTAREARDEIMGYGTRVVIHTMDTPDGTVEYWRKVRMRVTSYSAATSGKPPDHPAYGITRSGVPSGYGVVAVDPTVVPFRSQVYVPGYGVAFAGDTGGGVKGRWIDLGYPDGELVHWAGYVDVYYLTPVPEAINYRLPTRLP